MKTCSLLILLIIFCISAAAAQDLDQSFDDLFNDLFLEEENVDGLEEVYQQLYYFYQNPIELNTTDAIELKKLLILDDFQVEAFLNYRKEAGELLSIYELQSIEGWQITDVKKMLPFITIHSKERISTASNVLLVRFERDLQLRKGYRKDEEGNSHYLGTPDKVLVQLRSGTGGKLQYGFTAEKDGGENLIIDRNTNRYGMDHYSGYIKINNLNNLELVIGDYQLQMGQGLVYSSGFSLGKSGGGIATYQRVSSGLRPHTSSQESTFLRGAAASLYLPKDFKLTGFVSLNAHDAVIKDTSFSSFNTSGLHRSYNELNYRNSVKERHLGLVIEQKSNNLQYGIGFSANQLSEQWRPRAQSYNYFSYAGDQLNTFFGHFNYRWQNISTFGEGAYLLGGGAGFVGGALVNLSSVVQTGFIYRNYQPDFISLYGNALGEKSRNSNERGLLWVLNADFSKKLKAGIYLDKFYFPWLSYRISKPSSGYEYMIHLQYRPSKSATLNLQYKEEEKERDLNQDNLTVTEKFKKKRYKVRLNYVINEQLEMRSMIQGSFTSSENNGIALLQDVIYSTLQYKLIFRYSLFDTDNFQNRQYVYENDVLYAFNFPALQGTGYKFYILAKYNISKKFKCWLRFSQVTYTDRKEISSGQELVKGNKLSEAKFQVTYNF